MKHLPQLIRRQRNKIVVQKIIQNTGAERISRPGCFNRIRIDERLCKYLCIAIVSSASVLSHGQADQPYFGIPLRKNADPLVKILQSGKPLNLIVGDLQNIAMLQSPGNLDFCFLKIIPQRRTKIRIKRTDTAGLLSIGQRSPSSRPGRFIRQRQGPEMKDPAVTNTFLIDFFRRQFDIGTGFAIKRKVPVAAFHRMYKCKGGMNFIIHFQPVGINSLFSHRLPELMTEHIISDLADE